MKVWRGYGSEHSANLVMIGRFSTPEDALLAVRELEELIGRMEENFDYDKFEENRMSLYQEGPIRDILEQLRLYTFSAEDIETLVRDHSMRRRRQEIEIRTDEYDVSGFLKFMVHKGARVEVYSAHDFPDESSSRGD